MVVVERHTLWGMSFLYGVGQPGDRGVVTKNSDTNFANQCYNKIMK